MITLTERAANHVSDFLVKRGKGVGLRLGVRTSGCSGLAYRIEYADAVNPDDRTFESHGVKVVVDPKRSEEHTSELQSQSNLVCRLLLEKKKQKHRCSWNG